jgi:predicted membrane protein
MKLIKRLLFVVALALTVVAFTSTTTYAYDGGELVSIQEMFTVGSVVSDVIGVVTEWVVAFWAIVISSITSAVALVYDPTGLTLADRITFIGYLALFGLGIGIVKLGMAFVMQFFKKG